MIPCSQPSSSSQTKEAKVFSFWEGGKGVVGGLANSDKEQQVTQPQKKMGGEGCPVFSYQNPLDLT